MDSFHACNLKSPADLQGQSIEQLNRLCAEIRHALIEKVFQSGGHLGSNLGVVELTVALHKVFDFSRDKLVFDVSHQCYVHKMLTGRYQGFDQLRQTNGMSGFINRDESEYDLLTAGHAGTSISFAAGLAAGMKDCVDENDIPPWSVAFIGDAAFASGVAFEGLNQAAEAKSRMLVVLNDNEWSISKSVGAMARYLSRIRSSQTLQKAYDRLDAFARSLPWLGDRLEDMGEVLRHVMVPGHIFEELGINYIGPLDGHNLEEVTEALIRAKRLEGPTLLHFLTEKGKGYEPAGYDPERAHGVKPPSKVPAINKNKSVGKSFTSAFTSALCDLARRNTDIHAITAGMPSGTGLIDFQKKFPARFHDTGITEQHAVALAGGLATAGKLPVVAIYSTFLQRGYDQVFQEVALQRENVTFCLDRAGLVGQDGPTHMGLYDIAYLRALPGFTLAAPRDESDLRSMLELALKSKGPWGLRWPRSNCELESFSPGDLRPEMKVGKSEILRDGKDGVVFAYGAVVKEAMNAAEILEEEKGVSLAVYDARFVKPLDAETIIALAHKYSFFATVEEHSIMGGFGSAVLELLAAEKFNFKENNLQFSLHAVPDMFIPHMSTRDEQLDYCGLSARKLCDSWARHFHSTLKDTHAGI